MKKSDAESCIIRDTLALVLRISKFHGAAPLHFKPHGNGYITRASKLGACTWIFFVLHTGIVGVGLIMDLHVFGTSKAIRVKTTSALIVWLGDLGTLLTTVVLGVINGESRMKNILKLQKAIEKIREDVRYDYRNPRENLFGILFIAFLIYTYIVMVMDYAMFILDAYVNEREMSIVYLYGFVYIGYILTLLITMQVVFVILTIHATSKSINISLQKLTDILKIKDKKPTPINDSLPELNITRTTTITNRWIGQIDDVSAHDSIQHLSDSYILLCKVVGNFIDENGLLLLILLASFIGNTFITNYYMIRDLCSPDLINKWKRVSSVLIPVVWTVLRFVEVLTLIESFQRTHDEMSLTQVLLSKAIYCMTPVGQPTCTELDAFYKQIVIYKPSFSPLSICTLQRSQLAAIFACVVTYMIIILQYGLIEECK